ncbi:MAG: ABC transporter ATP-binding protein, partial [Patescibacteria group bacterium]|nr:ABC transporter ATP-binding protein [Patescibacteria group bacterium]
LKYDEQRAEHDTKVTAVLADAVSNTSTIRLFTNKRHEEERFHDITAKHRAITTLSWNIAEVNDAVQWGLVIFIEFAVMAIAVRLWSQGQLTIGDLAMLQGFLFALFNHISRLGRIIRRTYEAFADAKEMVAILDTPHEVADADNAKDLAVGKGVISFTNVTFRYRKTRTVFNKFSLNIKEREKIALVGPSGSGKSTVVQVLLREFNIQGGTIRIDGQNIARATRKSVRQNIAVVPQDPVLFHRSLMENIRYGRLGASDAEVMEAASKAHCDVFIEKLPQGFDTYVGERGIKLSGGERQRIAIARAILKDAPIFILDEATSSLDSQSEALIQDALEQLMQNKTSIVIAHRLSTILKMDRIIVMEGGNIVDSGTHAELARKEGIYKKLWKIQSEGFIV